MALSAPAGLDRPLHEVWVFLGLTFALAVAVALALPRSELAPLLSIAVPVFAVAITIATAVPRGSRRAAWAGVGFGRPSWHALVLAVVVPAAVVALSFALAAVLGVVAFQSPGGGFGDEIIDLCSTTLLFTVILLGEEIGWRGFLLLRLRALVTGRTAALLAGACHAVFHLPLLTLTTTYHSAGSRWIVVPTVTATVTLAGVWYAWLRLRSGSIWAVGLSHSAFNSFVEGTSRAAISSSPAAMAYTTTETGVVTLLIVMLLAAYLLSRRATDFATIP